MIPHQRSAEEVAIAEIVWVEGGMFRTGSDNHCPEERPAHAVTVSGFFIDTTPVTNAQYQAFVEATGHVTVAEIPPDSKDYRGTRPEMLKAGSLVFTPPPIPWICATGASGGIFRASWRRPYGPTSSIKGLENHPVVHIAHADARAYAHWADKDLPTEAEWEFAARGGLTEAEYAWGDDFSPDGQHLANTWQGEFPKQNLCTDGFDRTSPVTAFPPNGYGVHDMIGNVWEWTSDWYSQKHDADAPKACCIPENPRGGREDGSYDPRQPNIRIPRKVLKGGSHLCAPNYCRRYRPAARHAEPIDTSASHVGFRCITRKRITP